MLHAKFQDHNALWFWRRFLKVFAFYSHGSHLGHVTWTIYVNFRSPFLRMINMKFGFDWPSGFKTSEEKTFEHNGQNDDVLLCSKKVLCTTFSK